MALARDRLLELDPTNTNTDDRIAQSCTLLELFISDFYVWRILNGVLKYSKMHNWLQLANRTVIITGSASGIGSALVEAFYSQGCSVFMSDVKTENIKYPQQNSNLKNKIAHMKCDVRSKDDTIAMIQNADNFAREHAVPLPSIIVNAAGITRDGFIHELTEENYDDVLDTNLKGTFHSIQAFCRPDRLRKILSTDIGSSIINIGSVISERGNIGQTNYAASKGGVVGMTRALAKEMAYQSIQINKSRGELNSHAVIRVNSILPGFINTPMTQTVPSNIKQRIISGIPLRRFGEPSDVANMALFLASDRSSYVTGECLECSGAIAI